MPCPFLKGGHARSCSVAPYRKMLLSSLISEGLERCSNPSYHECSWYQAQPSLCSDVCPPTPSCPFLHDSLVQYCSADSTPKLIPYAEPSLSRCATDSHRYCELFLALVEPDVVSEHAVTESASGAEQVEPREVWIEGIRVPGWLFYSSNHMWLDLSSEGYCHVGIDGFLAAVLESIEGLTFVGNGGIRRPSVVIAADGKELQLIFPNPFQVTYANHYLRSHPDRIRSDPYSFGWLFEGMEVRGGEIAVTEGLMRGKEAFAWMRQECDRLTQFIHRRLPSSELEGVQLATDGGTWARGLLQHISREDALALFNEFFSPFINGGGRLGVAR